MNERITRRQALGTTGAAIGISVCSHKAWADMIKLNPKGRWQEYAWSRGPDKNARRELKPGETPVRLACSSPATRLWYPGGKQSITEAVKRIRDLGYTSAGVAHGPFNHNKWIDATDSEVRELKEALKTYDVTFFDMMTYDNIVHPDKSMRDKGIKHVTENLVAADKCGAEAVCAGLGSRDPDFGLGMHSDNWTEETWKLGVKGIKQILKDSAGCKSVLGMEAVITTPLDGPVAIKSLQEDVGDPRCQVALDPANMFTVANYYHSTEMIDMCFDILGESIANCHAKDTFIERDKMLALITMKPAGKGVQDYVTYLTRMSQLKRTRTLLLEFAKDHEYPAAKAYVEEMAKKAGVTIYQ